MSNTTTTRHHVVAESTAITGRVIAWGEHDRPVAIAYPAAISANWEVHEADGTWIGDLYDYGDGRIVMTRVRSNLRRHIQRDTLGRLAMAPSVEAATCRLAHAALQAADED